MIGQMTPLPDHLALRHRRGQRRSRRRDRARSIVVTKVPDYCIDEVSDHAMALLLAAARKITLSNAQVHAGRWEMPAVVPIHRLRGSVLGLAGFGRIPQLVAPKAKAFGLTVIAYDPFVPRDVFAREGVESVDFAQLLARSDYISIHTPLMPETRGLFGADAFRQMKPGGVPDQHRPRPDRGRGRRWPRRSTRGGWPARRSTSCRRSRRSDRRCSAATT